MQQRLWLLALLVLAACGGPARATETTPPSPTGRPANPVSTAALAPVLLTPSLPAGQMAVWGPPLPALADGQTYHDPQERFSFTVPRDWVQARAASAEVAFQSPASRGTVPAWINVVLEPLSGSGVTLDEYDQAGADDLRQWFPDYTEVRRDRVTVDGRPAYKRVFTALVNGGRMQLQQLYLIDRDTAFVVTLGATQATFAGHATLFDQIAGTFRVSGKTAAVPTTSPHPSA